MKRTKLSLMTWMFLGAGCGGENPQPQNPLIEPQLEAAEWGIDSVPLRVLGRGNFGDADFFQDVRGAGRTSNGTIVVAVAEEQSILAYLQGSPEPFFIGRRGGGPGEFLGLNDIFVTGADNIIARDLQGFRVTTFSISGEVQSLFSHRPTYFEMAGVTDSGSILFLDRPIPFDREGLVRGERSSVLLWKVGRSRRSTVLGTSPGDWRFFHSEGPVHSQIEPWFTPSLRAHARGELIVWGNTGDSLIYLRDLSSGEEKVLALPPDFPTTLGSDPIVIVQSRVGSNRGPWYRAHLVLLEMDRNDRPRNSWDRIMIDEPGLIWIRVPHFLPSLPRRWVILDRSGNHLASITLPASAGQILQIDVDRLLTRTTGDWDETLIAEFALSRVGPTGEGGLSPR